LDEVGRLRTQKKDDLTHPLSILFLFFEKQGHIPFFVKSFTENGMCPCFY
jgi:hypothetical protein